MTVAVNVDNLGKRYRLGGDGYSRLSEAIYGLADRWFGRRRTGQATGEFWALRGASFEVGRGEIVGVVGRNGAGKSTLLKILSRITEPTEGRFGVAGRVASLLEVGTGFHPELTGRENVFLGGTLLGMSRGEIRKQFDAIVEFSELERFLDTPVKRYSSGMYVRLGFAVAAHLRPEVLLLDEVLAVGDAQFQRKCLGKVGDLAADGRAALFVSHNLGAVAQLCSRAVVLDAGRVVFVGPAAEAIHRYLALGVSDGNGRLARFPHDPAKQVCVVGVGVACPGKDERLPLDVADPLELSIEFEVHRPTRGAALSFRIDREGPPVFASFDTDTSPERLDARAEGFYRARVSLPRRLLKAGRYTVSVGAGVLGAGPIDSREAALSFEIEEVSEDLGAFSFSRRRSGALIVPLTWDQTRLDPSPGGDEPCEPAP